MRLSSNKPLFQLLFVDLSPLPFPVYDLFLLEQVEHAALHEIPLLPLKFRFSYAVHFFEIVSP